MANSSPEFPRHRRRRRVGAEMAGQRIQGFTLLEVMVATAILALALTALLGSQSRSLALLHEGRCQLLGATVAQEMLTAMAFRQAHQPSAWSGEISAHPGFTWSLRQETVLPPAGLGLPAPTLVRLRVEGSGGGGRCVNETSMLTLSER